MKNYLAVQTRAYSTAVCKGILSRQHSHGITSLDASAVIEGLSGAECPAGAAVRLVANTVSDGGALRPNSADIAILRDIITAILQLSLSLEYNS